MQTERDQKGTGDERGPQVMWPSRFQLGPDLGSDSDSPTHNLCDRRLPHC